ncbi:hypothetical protein Hypma_001499 [Hypsizygus marmoreus]|uniref:Uncharacterized protein n=1 Tax=Hypsizygus marmoreus TaxID=39966 RepID=A0A369K2P9_HYPMA|nr:hypothetical protein Hypma_001499 [Hypsizygus marmoreus]
MPPMTTSDTIKRVDLPGFTLPLNFTPRAAFDTFELRGSDGEYVMVHYEAEGEGENLFPNALNGNDLAQGGVSLRITSLREIAMMQLMNQLTDKPDWDRKVFDDKIVSLWKAEVLADQERDISQQMADWCIAELQWKAGIFRPQGAVSVYNGDVVKSDATVPESLKEALKAAVKTLEDIPAAYQDWHPESDNQVLDLVHPSLFPLVYGRTRILHDSHTCLEGCIRRCGEGTTVPVPPEYQTKLGDRNVAFTQERIKPYSRKFQWLPCDIDVSGDQTRITSYINNLHPDKYRNLYGLIEQILTQAIPLWNMTLTPLRDAGYMLRRIQCKDIVYDDVTGLVIQPEPGEFRSPKQRTLKKESDRQDDGESGDPNDVFNDSDDEDDYVYKEPVDLRRQYAARGLQVIIKLANIQLTPEKPDYAGGSWHVEGQLNEHICATALYYYDSANITPSSLAFRHQCNDHEVTRMRYEQNDHAWLEQIFGCKQYGPTVQVLGAVETKEGRLLTFPNVLQHRVQPFSLLDHTKPGYRRILALFLVDPGTRITALLGMSHANGRTGELILWVRRSSWFRVFPGNCRITFIVTWIFRSR